MQTTVIIPCVAKKMGSGQSDITSEKGRTMLG